MNNIRGKLEKYVEWTRSRAKWDSLKKTLRDGSSEILKNKLARNWSRIWTFARNSSKILKKLKTKGGQNMNICEGVAQNTETIARRWSKIWTFARKSSKILKKQHEGGPEHEHLRESHPKYWTNARRWSIIWTFARKIASKKTQMLLKSRSSFAPLKVDPEM